MVRRRSPCLMRIIKNCALYLQLELRGYDDQHTSEKQPVANDKARSLVDLACLRVKLAANRKCRPKDKELICVSCFYICCHCCC